MKKVHIILILVIVTVVLVLVVKHWHHKRAKNIFEWYDPPSNVVIEERIGKQISALKMLSTTEMVRQLDKLEHYGYPGAFIGAKTIFLYDADGNIATDSLYQQNKIELEKILSSRAFRKSLQDLGKLPKNRASELLASELDTALSRYLELYNVFFESQSTGFTRGELADGQPVLRGLRYKLFALVLIAGSLELTDVYEKITKIDDFAKGQKINILHIEDRGIRADYSLLASLHNNLILGSGLYGTSSRKGDPKLKPFADRFADHKIVDFSAPGTEYDVMVRHGIQELVPDKEYINIRYFDQMTNEDLNELRRILGLL